MIPLSFPSTSSNVHESLSEFWLISRADVATPPALAALPPTKRTPFSWRYFVASNVVGTRIVSEPVKTNFSGVFISDKSSNFELAYDVEYGEITHNTLSNTFEPLDSKYPIVAYSNSDYATFSVIATHITNNSVYGEVDVKAEKQARDNLMSFLKDRKPKVYRDGKGDLKIITISGKPTEQPHTINGIMKVSFNAIEIGNVEDMDTLISYGLVDWISDLI